MKTHGPSSTASSLNTPEVGFWEAGIVLDSPWRSTVIYPGVTRLSEASSLRLTPGAELGGLDLTLQRFTTVEVRGQVVYMIRGPEIRLPSADPRTTLGRRFDVRGLS